MKQADLILAIGSRLGDTVTQGYELLPTIGGAPIMQVHPDGAEIGRVFRPALGIVSDLNAFAVAAAALDPVRAGWEPWTKELRRSPRARTPGPEL